MHLQRKLLPSQDTFYQMASLLNKVSFICLNDIGVAKRQQRPKSELTLRLRPRLRPLSYSYLITEASQFKRYSRSRPLVNSNRCWSIFFFLCINALVYYLKSVGKNKIRVKKLKTPVLLLNY